MFRNFGNYHAKLLSDLQSTAIPFNKGGVCFGYAMMGMQAILLMDTAAFDARIRKLSALSSEEISAQLDIPEHPDRKFWIDVQAYLTNLNLYQKPSKYRYLFGKYYSQQYEKVAEIVLPQKLKDQGGLQPAGSCYGIYQTNELQQLLTSLHQALDDAHIHFPAAFLLHSGNHAIVMGYYPNYPYWILINVNQGESKLITSDRAAGMVNQAFSDNSVTALKVEAYTTAVHQEKTAQILEKWKHESDFLNTQDITIARAAVADSYHASLLYLAVDANDIEHVGDILKLNHTNITTATTAGINPLHLAAMNGRGECMKLILAYPDLAVNQRMKGDGLSALDLAVNYGFVDCLLPLLKYPGILINEESKGMTPLYRAALMNHADCADELLKMKGIEVNKMDPHGMTPLNVAIVLGRSKMVKSLLDHPHIVTDRINVDGDSALTKAVACNDMEIVKIILEKCPHLIELNVNGKSTLQIAKACGHTIMADFLQNFINSRPVCASLHSHVDTPAQSL